MSEVTSNYGNAFIVNDSDFVIDRAARQFVEWREDYLNPKIKDFKDLLKSRSPQISDSIKAFAAKADHNFLSSSHELRPVKWYVKKRNNWRKADTRNVIETYGFFVQCVDTLYAQTPIKQNLEKALKNSALPEPVKNIFSGRKPSDFITLDGLKKTIKEHVLPEMPFVLTALVVTSALGGLGIPLGFSTVYGIVKTAAAIGKVAKSVFDKKVTDAEIDRKAHIFTNPTNEKNLQVEPSSSWARKAALGTIAGVSLAVSTVDKALSNSASNGNFSSIEDLKKKLSVYCESLSDFQKDVTRHSEYIDDLSGDIAAFIDDSSYASDAAQYLDNASDELGNLLKVCDSLKEALTGYLDRL